MQRSRQLATLGARLRVAAAAAAGGSAAARAWQPAQQQLLSLNTLASSSAAAARAAPEHAAALAATARRQAAAAGRRSFAADAVARPGPAPRGTSKAGKNSWDSDAHEGMHCIGWAVRASAVRELAGVASASSRLLLASLQFPALPQQPTHSARTLHCAAGSGRSLWSGMFLLVPGGLAAFLGKWQWDRREWKRELLERREGMMQVGGVGCGAGLLVLERLQGSCCEIWLGDAVATHGSRAYR